MKKEKEASERQERENREKAEKKRLEEDALLKKQIEQQEINRIESLRKQEKDILDNRSQPLRYRFLRINLLSVKYFFHPIRQYLADLVVPYLTEGLIKICKDMPSNPIGQLVNNWFEHFIIQ